MSCRINASRIRNAPLHRLKMNCCPIEVVSIPLAIPLTETFRAEVPKLMDERMPQIMRQNLSNQLRLSLKR
ncbi:phage tail protein [Salmonella enterica subsp. enterica serovar Newport]